MLVPPKFHLKAKKLKADALVDVTKRFRPHTRKSVDVLNEKGLDEQVSERPNHDRSSDALALTFSAIWTFDNLIWLNNPT